MMNLYNFLKKSIRVSGRSIVLYIAVFALLIPVLKHDNALKRAKLRALNRIIPFMDYMAGIVEERAELNNTKLKEYLDYYKIVDEYIPGRDDVKAMLGFCYYHLGKDNKAISSYRKSVELNPHFFWSHYNLGVIYFQKGEHKKAAQSFEKAVAAKPDITSMVIYASKVYQDILNELKDSKGAVEKRLRSGYRDGYLALVLNYYHLKDFSRMRQYASRAIQLDIKEKEIFYYYAGLAAYELKDYKNAVYFLQEYIKKNSTHAEAFYYMGLSLEALGKKAVSATILQKAAVLREVQGSLNPFEDKVIALRIF